jgi:hypothetical protein
MLVIISALDWQKFLFITFVLLTCITFQLLLIIIREIFTLLLLHIITYYIIINPLKLKRDI